MKTKAPRMVLIGRDAVHVALDHGHQLYTRRVDGAWAPCSNRVAIESRQLFGEDWPSWAYAVATLPTNEQRCAACRKD